MKPFHNDKCPICHKLLKPIYTKGFTNGYRLYECKGHYFLSEDSDHWPVYANIYIPDFLLSYDLTATGISKLDSLMVKSSDQTIQAKISLPSYRFVCTLDYHLELDWADLKSTSNRLQKLIIFS